jgi:hypothetical protein
MDHFATFKVGDLTAVIGDNAASGKHRAGYNGVWNLVHKNEPDNVRGARFHVGRRAYSPPPLIRKHSDFLSLLRVRLAFHTLQRRGYPGRN